MLLPLRTLLVVAATLCATAHARTLYGFTPFPYDATPDAVNRTAQIVRENSTLAAFHFDDGVPWEALLDNKPLPRKQQKEWDDLARSVPAGRPVYVGLAPLAKDRKSLAPNKTDSGEGPLPRALRSADLDDDRVKAAYLELARRAIAQFKPTYLNLGIEAGEMASRDPRRWGKFEALYRYVAEALRHEHPQVKLGISFGLQSLRKPDVAKRAKALIDQSDYLGLSFYPHASPFGERFGEPPLGKREAAWREPFEWLRAYTRKPIALCETGYLSQNAEIKSLSLSMQGDPTLQAAYMRELAQTAERENYLFVVWFLAVDYERLFERMKGSPGNDVNLLWRNIGLWSGDVQPKPAWEEWKRAVRGEVTRAAPVAAAAAATVPPVVAKSVAAAGLEIGFGTARQLFTAGPGSAAELDGDNGMRWSYEYRKKDWAWMVRDIGAAVPATTQSMKLRLRSDRPGTLFVQLEEKSGQTFFAMIEPREAWTDVSVELRSLQPDPAKRKDGMLQPERLTKLLVADPAGRDDATGRRTVWIQSWRLE